MQADLKTFGALGVYGCAVPAALTAQNTTSVASTFAVPAEFLEQQIDTLFADVSIDAVKIGMLGSLDAIRTVSAALRRHRPPHIVLDTVFRATTGSLLIDPRALDAFREGLVPLATVITPNAREAGVLLNSSAPRTVKAATACARELVAGGARAALVTGGHLPLASESVDVLCDGERVYEFRVARVAGPPRHGTGCALSSAIAARLALGDALPQACERAQVFVAKAIAASDALRVGKGAAPVNHFFTGAANPSA